MALEDEDRFVVVEVFDEEAAPLDEIEWLTYALLLCEEASKFTFILNPSDNFAATIDIRVHPVSALLFVGELAKDFDDGASSSVMLYHPLKYLSFEGLCLKPFTGKCCQYVHRASLIIQQKYQIHPRKQLHSKPMIKHRSKNLRQSEVQRHSQ